MGKVISMEEYMATRAGASTPDDLRLKLEYFLVCFEAVFGDADWEMTRDILAAPESYIASGGTFLEPGVRDESNNWHNRGALLSSYRALKAELGKPRVV
jgi:hypothetical protein